LYWRRRPCDVIGVHRTGVYGTYTVVKGLFDQGLVNHELWLPTGGDVRFSARILLMKGVRQNIHFQNDRYQKFRADAVQQTGVTVVEPAKQ
jgi:hypothetical protein